MVLTGKLPKAFGVARSYVARAARFFAERSWRRVSGTWHEVTVHLVRDAGSEAMHRAIMGVGGATDVITQAYDSIPPEEPGLYGELFVNTDQALRAAPKRRGWSPAQELLLYIAHGMDHLSGADDLSAADYARMRRRELAWIRSWIGSGFKVGA